jgi:arginyl-tRNA synthetase
MIEVKRKLVDSVQDVLKNLGAVLITVINGDNSTDHPGDLSHGDYATNIALVYAKSLGLKPHELAEKIVSALQKKSLAEVEKIDIAGPGFINFHLKPERQLRILSRAIIHSVRVILFQKPALRKSWLNTPSRILSRNFTSVIS